MILIVDDKPENLFSLKSILALNGFEVDTADSGEAALRKILKNTYSLIILDVQMPVMNGFEVAETISSYSKSKDVPILFLSAVNKDKGFITKGYKSGGMDYITKPVDPDILLLKVKTYYKLYEQKLELNRIQESLLKEIDGRKKAQEELSQRMEELRLVLESLPQIAFTLNNKGDLEFGNHEWYKYCTDKSNWPETHKDDQAVFGEWQKSFEKGQAFVSEVRIRPLNGDKFRYFLLKIIPVIQGGAIVRWVGTFTDIDEQKEANRRLEEKVIERTSQLVAKNEELEMRNHELQQFTWVTSHDLKEPLRKIQTINSIITEKYLTEGHAAAPYLARASKASERMTQLINDLLNYSRLSVETDFKTVDLNDIVSDILSDLEVSLLEKKAKVAVGQLGTVEGIPSQLRQVFQNLISNSLKFSKKEIIPEISITGEYVDDKEVNSLPAENGKYFRIVVKDNGIGFSENYLDRIFTIFQRLNPADKYEGTGIGLAIAKKVVEKHNGLITARGRENEGATFIVLLPVKQQTTSKNEPSA
ncbi:MAG TPA: response regulator [Bacteroidia bacterium]|nr:response regulator [Bacteroidia bacterium]